MSRLSRTLLYLVLAIILLSGSFPVGESAIGVNWGTISFHRLKPSTVVDLLKDNNIKRVKLFDADPGSLTALMGSGIEVMVGIPNEMLAALSSSTDASDLWVRQNVSRYVVKGGADIRYVAVGNEPFLTSYSGQFQSFVIPALLNLQQSLVKANLAGYVKLVVPCNADAYESSLPSQGAFRPELTQIMTQLVSFLNSNGSPFVVNIYPFLSLYGNSDFPQDYAFFEGSTHPVTDGSNVYYNAFDGNFDTLVAALNKLGYGQMPIVIGEVGWPTDGAIGANLTAARVFNQGLIKHVLSNKGTPLRPDAPPMDIYLFALLDEGAKSVLPGNFERHWGIFSFDGQAKYALNLGLGNKLLKNAKNVEYLPSRWCVADPASARESIVRAVVTNLHLLDLHMQVSLFKKLLLMVRNLRAESDRMHALACICRTALCVDLFAKESVRRGQKPLAGTDIASLFEDARIRDDLNSVRSKSLFREELVASLVESCFQLSLPLPEQKSSGMESRVIGALAYGTGYGALNWTEPALEVVEVCRPCVKWDCNGRTYAVDCYLKLLVRLCHIYDTRGGVKTIKDGASQDQILNETRLQNLQRELVKDLREVNTPRIYARLIWAISEHINLEGLDPLLADDPDDPLNIIISNIHKVLFNVDSPANTSNRLQDVQAVLLSAQRLGSRSLRAGQLLSKELEEFRNNGLADSVNKHQCRLILQRIKYVQNHPDSRWTGVSEARGDYPFSHHKLTVQFYEAAAAQDRKLEGLVHRAILELWRPDPSELTILLTKGIDSPLLKLQPTAHTLTGSSDPCYVEAYHLADSGDGRITLHLKVLNLTELELDRVDIRVGLSGGLYFMDGSTQAVRQLRNLVSQDPVLCSVTLGVSHFERCALWVQVLYYPFYGRGAINDGDYAEEDQQIMKQKRSSRPELGEPVILRCQPYKIPLTELLLPHKISPVEFFRLWPSLPAVVEYTGTYIYEGSGFKATAAQQYGSSPFLGGLKSLSSKPFHRVCSHIIRTVAGFQLCYAAKTWYGGFLGMMIFGASEMSRNVDLGDETTTMICKFVVRASDASITKEIEADLQSWLDDLADGGVEYMPEDEVKEAAAERLRISMERIALFKAAQPPPKTPKSDDEEEEEKEDDEEKKENENDGDKKEHKEDGKKPKGTLSKLTAEEVEHMALQTAVLQEWHVLCKERSSTVN